MSELKSREQMAEEHLHDDCAHAEESYKYRHDCVRCTIDFLRRRDEMIVEWIAEERAARVYASGVLGKLSANAEADAIRALKEQLK